MDADLDDVIKLLFMERKRLPRTFCLIKQLGRTWRLSKNRGKWNGSKFSLTWTGWSVVLFSFQIAFMFQLITVAPTYKYIVIHLRGRISFADEAT